MSVGIIDQIYTQPARSGAAPQALVVLLHGVGANGQDLIGLAPYWADLLPEAEFLSPDAPFPFDMAPFGRQWFSLQDLSPASRLAGARRAAPLIDTFLDAELAKRGLDDRRLILVGFSQGCMMALHCGLRRKAAPAAIIGYSGMLIAPEAAMQEITARPPVLLVHGAEDTVVPPQALPLAEQALTALGVPVRAVMRPGLAHSIDQEGLEAGGHFIRQALDAPR